MTGGPTPPAAPEPRERPRPQVEPPATRRLASYGGPDVGQEMRRAEQDRLVTESERQAAERQAAFRRKMDAAIAAPICVVGQGAGSEFLGVIAASVPVDPRHKAAP